MSVLTLDTAQHQSAAQKRQIVGLIKACKIAESRDGKCLSTAYKNSKTLLLWKCGKGHQWFANYDHVSRGTWCPECATCKKTVILEKIHQLAAQNGGKCLSTMYQNNKTPLSWKCAKGHTWSARYNHVSSSGSWCPECAKIHRRPTLEKIQQLAARKGGECLSTAYKNHSTPLLWRCGKGHQWSARYNHVSSSGSWCPECAKTYKRPTLEKIHQLAARKGGKCLSTVYQNNKTPLSWKCAKGHMWSARYNHVSSSGSWCPVCARYGRRRLQTSHPAMET